MQVEELPKEARESRGVQCRRRGLKADKKEAIKEVPEAKPRKKGPTPYRSPS